jgi:protein-S-isoprenylcysteine O-methyltransferase Ste14
MAKKPATWLLIFLGPVVYLALAAAGWGGIGNFIAQPPFVAVAVVTFLLAGASLFTRASLSPGVREDRSNRWIIFVLLILGVLDAFVPAYTDRINFWSLDGEMVRWIGVTLYASGGVLRIWPVFVLGHRFSGLVAIQRDHQLVTTGIYRFIRNPSYLGLLINLLGWNLTFRSVVGILLASLTLVPLVARMHSEERLLHEHFGAEYDAYKARTSRLIPGIY